MPFPSPRLLMGQPALPREAADMVRVFCVCVKSTYFLNVNISIFFYFKRNHTYIKTSNHLVLDIPNNLEIRKTKYKRKKGLWHLGMAQLESKSTADNTTTSEWGDGCVSYAVDGLLKEELRGKRNRNSTSPSTLGHQSLSPKFPQCLLVSAPLWAVGYPPSLPLLGSRIQCEHKSLHTWSTGSSGRATNVPNHHLTTGPAAPDPVLETAAPISLPAHPLKAGGRVTPLHSPGEVPSPRERPLPAARPASRAPTWRRRTEALETEQDIKER